MTVEILVGSRSSFHHYDTEEQSSNQDCHSQHFPLDILPLHCESWAVNEVCGGDLYL